MIKRVPAKIRRRKRHIRIRKKVMGTSSRPRMCVTKTNKHLYVGFFDDVAGKTVCSFSTLTPELRQELKRGSTTGSAQRLGAFAAAKALEKGIRQVVFDRNGYPYHGRVKALAEAARKGGLEF